MTQLFRWSLIGTLAGAVVAGCGGPRAGPPSLSIEERVGHAAVGFSECLASDGVACVDDFAATASWAAQQDLELVAAHPLATVVDSILKAADLLSNGPALRRRAQLETERAVASTKRLGCRPAGVVHGNVELKRRRQRLERRAAYLGFHRTKVGLAWQTLVGAAAKLDDARVVRLVCTGGQLVVLVARSEGQLDASEDPEAHAAGVWRAVVASESLDRLLRHHESSRPTRPLGPDTTRVIGAVDPWIPVNDMEL